jgi:hypothetical protein
MATMGLLQTDHATKALAQRGPVPSHEKQPLIEDRKKADGRITMRLSQPEMLFTAQQPK